MNKSTIVWIKRMGCYQQCTTRPIETPMLSCGCPWHHSTDILSFSKIINRLRPEKCCFAGDIFKCIFFNENAWISIKISLKFVLKGPINNIPSLVQIMAWRRPGDKPLTELMKVILPMHTCITWPQWVISSKLKVPENGKCHLLASDIRVNCSRTSLNYSVPVWVAPLMGDMSNWWHTWKRVGIISIITHHTLKRKCHHSDDIFVANFVIMTFPFPGMHILSSDIHHSWFRVGPLLLIPTWICIITWLCGFGREITSVLP